MSPQLLVRSYDEHLRWYASEIARMCSLGQHDDARGVAKAERSLMKVRNDVASLNGIPTTDPD